MLLRKCKHIFWEINVVNYFMTMFISKKGIGWHTIIHAFPTRRSSAFEKRTSSVNMEDYEGLFIVSKNRLRKIEAVALISAFLASANLI